MHLPSKKSAINVSTLEEQTASVCGLLFSTVNQERKKKNNNTSNQINTLLMFICLMYYSLGKDSAICILNISWKNNGNIQVKRAALSVLLRIYSDSGPSLLYMQILCIWTTFWSSLWIKYGAFYINSLFCTPECCSYAVRLVTIWREYISEVWILLPTRQLSLHGLLPTDVLHKKVHWAQGCTFHPSIIQNS